MQLPNRTIDYNIGAFPRIFALIALALTVTLPLVHDASATSPAYGYSRQWGTFGGPSAPNMLALDASGNLYIADSQNLAVGKIAPNGTMLSLWGGPTQFGNPFGIAVDNARNTVYVTDSVKNTVYKYSTSGSLLASWNSNGTSNGRFGTLQGVAVNATGFLYVVDQGNQRVGIFRNDGVFVKYFKLGPPGNFLTPVGIAVDSQGYVYVDDDSFSSADTFAGNITRFTKNGVFVSTWTSSSPSLLGPQGLAVDNASNIYVVDNFENRIEEFDSSQRLIQSWGCTGTSQGELSGPVGVTVNSQGTVFVSDPANFNILKFSGTTGCGTLGTPPVLAYQQTGKFSGPQGVALDGQGNMFIVDQSNDRVQRFNSSTGNFLGAWGSYGNQPGQFDFPSGIVVDHTGKVYVSDSGNNRVERFFPNGTVIKTWGSFANCVVSCLDGQFYNPLDITIDSSDHVYVTDYNNARIQKFDSSGNFITKWGSNGTGPGQFQGPVGIAADSSNNVYVSDSMNNRIEKFSSSGTFLATWGSSGTGNNQFTLPEGIGLDSAGNIYVADLGNNRVVVFYGNGTFLATMGVQGLGNGQLSNPWGVRVDNLDNVYVTDFANNRVEVFAPLQDLAVTKLSLSKNSFYYGFNIVKPILMNITVNNSGLSDETFWLREFANTTIIAQQNLTLTGGHSQLVTFSWFPSLSRGTYNITARVQTVSGDPNPSNNIVQGGLFYVRLKGDVNGDCTVNVKDLSLVGIAFTSSAGPPPSSNWNPYADLNNDGVVNILDLVAVASNFGQTC